MVVTKSPAIDKERLRRLALDAGYDLVGFASLELSADDRHNLTRFARDGFAAGMRWFETHLHLRTHPAEVAPGSQSAMVLAVYYRDHSAEALYANAQRRVSRYALGRDYHRRLRKKGKALLKTLQRVVPELDGRIVVDSAPVPEKILARQAGLGWQGKHTNLINADLGSYFFLSVLLLNQPIAPDEEQPDLCGSCRLCLDACPTGALFADYRLDAGRCISYLTIERDPSESIEQALQNAKTADAPPVADFENWVFGCDICQEVCPYNRNRRTRERDTRDEAFRLRPIVRDFMNTGEPENINHAELFEGSITDLPNPKAKN